MKKIFDTYTLSARVFPAIICALPLFICWYFLSDNIQLRELGAFLVSLKFYGATSLSIVFLYLFSQIIRITSKYFENKYFVNAKVFPTTYLMTYSDKVFSDAYKDKFRALIQKQFDLVLFGRAQEENNIEEAIKRLNEAIKQVILKVGDGSLVKKHNIWYGFFRNLIGGSLYSVIFCSLNIFIGFYILNNNLLSYSSTVILILYLVVILFRKAILIQNGEAYAKQLIAEFISISQA